MDVGRNFHSLIHWFHEKRDGLNFRHAFSTHALLAQATAHGDITGLIHATGISPTQAPP